MVTWCDEISNGVKAKYLMGSKQLFFCVLIVLNYILDCLHRAALESCHALSPLQGMGTTLVTVMKCRQKVQMSFPFHLDPTVLCRVWVMVQPL